MFRDDKYKTAFINAQMMILRPNEKVDSNFLHCVAVSDYWISQLDLSSYGTAQQQLSNKILSNLTVVIPSLDEQKQILHFVKRETAKLDKLIAETEASIATLQEYRTALIASAVTGQIDVRSMFKYL